MMPANPNHVKYVITLDADTRLPRDTVPRLIGKMAHPLNRPRFDAVTGRDEARRADDIAQAVGLNMSDWWNASADGYLKHVSKAQIVEALRKAGCDPSERELSGLKKDALVTLAANRLAGTSWLPAQLRAGLSQ